MRVERRLGRDFELEPGDMVRISHPDAAGGVWAEVEVGIRGEEKTPSWYDWIPAGPGAVAMYLGEKTGEAPRPPPAMLVRQVLHEGRILNVRALYLQPER